MAEYEPVSINFHHLKGAQKCKYKCKIMERQRNEENVIRLMKLMLVLCERIFSSGKIGPRRKGNEVSN
jgi:hypothetical protein